LALWYQVSRLLRRLVRLPMVSAYDRLPAKISGMLGRYFNSLRPRLSSLTVPVHQTGLLARQLPKVRNQLEPFCGEEILSDLDRVLNPKDPKQSIPTLYAREISEHETNEGMESRTRRELQKVSRLGVAILQTVWGRLPVKDAFGAETKEAPGP